MLAVRVAVARVSAVVPHDENDTPPPEWQKPPLTDYPLSRTKLSLALDPYSRMSLPDRNGNREVQKRPTSDIWWGVVFCFLTIAVLGLLDQHIASTYGLPFMSGAWGTISILAFGTIENPAARWYNCFVATVFSTFLVAGVIILWGSHWYTRALALATSLGFMMWTGSVHPPAAAAVMACMDDAVWQNLGFVYVVYPVLFGSLFILTMGKLCAKMKREHEFVVAFRWVGFGHHRGSQSGVSGIGGRNGIGGRSGSQGIAGSRGGKGGARSMRKTGTINPWVNRSGFLPWFNLARWRVVRTRHKNPEPVLFRKKTFGFSSPPRFLTWVRVGFLPAAAAIRAADSQLDRGRVSETKALNDATGTTRMSKQSDGDDDTYDGYISLAKIDESRLTDNGVVTYSFDSKD